MLLVRYRPLPSWTSENTDVIPDRGFLSRETELTTDVAALTWERALLCVHGPGSWLRFGFVPWRVAGRPRAFAASVRSWFFLPPGCDSELRGQL